MTENEIGKVVVGLYCSHEAPLSVAKSPCQPTGREAHKATLSGAKGKNCYLLFFQFCFLGDLCVFV